MVISFTIIKIDSLCSTYLLKITLCIIYPLQTSPTFFTLQAVDLRYVAESYIIHST